VTQLADDCQLHLIESIDDLLDMRSWLGERREWLGCDVETEGLNLGRDRIRLWQFGDLRHGWAASWDGWSGALRDLLPAYDGRVVFHNSPFDLGMLAREGIRPRREQTHDTMIMAHLLEPRYGIGLKAMARRRVDTRASAGEEALKQVYADNGWDWKTIPIEHPAYWSYSAMDTCITAALAETIWDEVQPYRRVYDVEMACIHVLTDSRLRGMEIDVPYCDRKLAEYEVELEHLKAVIRDGADIDPGKDAQLQAYLRVLWDRAGGRGSFDSGWPRRKNPDGTEGTLTFDDKALDWYARTYPDDSTIIKPLRDWRKLTRLCTHYLRPLLRENVDGIVRCNIKPVGARHGRMSITEPALQTLPRGREIRDAFRAREGHKLILTDYMTMEQRVLASYAKCWPMVAAFARGEDLHRWTASLAYDVPMEQVTPKQRAIAKNVAYANLYGAGPDKMATHAGVPVHVVDAFLEKYHAMFPEISTFQAACINTVRERQRNEDVGYIYTVLGRRLPVDKDKVATTSVNYLCSSSATADVLKLKIVQVADALEAAGLTHADAQVLLPVHDEIICEARDEVVEFAAKIIEETMTELTLFDCPLNVEQDIVALWGEHYAPDDPAQRGHWAAGFGWVGAGETELNLASLGSRSSQESQPGSGS
jgi:DNA polymerase-1